MSINVVDAIMGSGKTESVIRFLKDNPQEKVLYITPYLAQVNRIRNSEIGCGPARIWEPRNVKNQEKKTTNKYNDVVQLMQQGKSVATTHAMFLGHPQELLDLIRNQGYTLIIDQALEVLAKNRFYIDDLKMLISTGRLAVENDCVIRTDEPYSGVLKYILEFFDNNKCHIVNMDSSDEDEDQDIKIRGGALYWSAMCQAITSAKDVYILTYMFDAQDMSYFLHINNAQINRIGIRELVPASDGHRGQYVFSSLRDSTVPDYVYDLNNMIHIVQERSREPHIYGFLDMHGHERARPLSKSWFSYDWAQGMVEDLKSRGFSVFTNIYKNVPPKQRMWGTYVSSDDIEVHSKKQIERAINRISDNREFGGAAEKLRSGVHSKSNFVVFNQRASNSYSHKTLLAYYCNLFAPPEKKVFLSNYGLEYDEDGYALSTMLQWIWRSAIRNQQEISIYVPSDRMRQLLEDWIAHPYIAKEAYGRAPAAI